MIQVFKNFNECRKQTISDQIGIPKNRIHTFDMKLVLNIMDIILNKILKKTR